MKYSNKEDAILHLPYSFLLTCFLIICSSCSEEIFFKSNYTKNEIVVNSMITPDSLFSCHLSKLVEPLQHAIPTIEDAAITIEHAQTGELIAKLDYNGGGWYRSSTHKPKIGVPYRLIVLVEGYDTITAQTTIPQKARAELFDLKFFSTTDKTVVDPTEHDKKHTLSFSIVDNIDIDDFYEIAMLRNFKLHAHVIFESLKTKYIELEDLEKILSGPNDIIADNILIRLDTLATHYAAFGFYCTDPIIEAESITPAVFTPATLIFSDKSFKNGVKKIAADLHPKSGSGGYTTYIRGDNLLCLRSLSPELFEYEQSVRKQQIAISKYLFNPLDGSFSSTNSQVDIATNIVNGYGIFGGYSVTNYMIAEDGKTYWWHKYIVQ